MDLLAKTHVLDDVIVDREEEILWYLHAGIWVESVVADNHDRKLSRGRVLQAWAGSLDMMVGRMNMENAYYVLAPTKAEQCEKEAEFELLHSKEHGQFFWVRRKLKHFHLDAYHWQSVSSQQ